MFMTLKLPNEVRPKFWATLMYGSRDNVPGVLKDFAVSGRDIEVQADRCNGAAALAAEERILRADPQLRHAVVRIESVKGAVRLTPDNTNLAEHNRPSFVDGHAALEA